MNIIEQIRASIVNHEKNSYYGDMEDTYKMIKEFYSKVYLLSDNEKQLQGEAEIVFQETEDRGDRWTLWEVKVYKLTQNNVTAYFKVQEEIGRTECQSDGGIVVEEAIPREVTVIRYESI